MANRRPRKWFIKVRGSYLPSSGCGWLTYIPYLTYLIAVMTYVVLRVHDMWLGIFLVVPNFVAAAVVMNWVAATKS